MQEWMDGPVPAAVLSASTVIPEQRLMTIRSKTNPTGDVIPVSQVFPYGIYSKSMERDETIIDPDASDHFHSEYLSTANTINPIDHEGEEIGISLIHTGATEPATDEDVDQLNDPLEEETNSEEIMSTDQIESSRSTPPSPRPLLMACKVDTVVEDEQMEDDDKAEESTPVVVTQTVNPYLDSDNQEFKNRVTAVTEKEAKELAAALNPVDDQYDQYIIPAWMNQIKCTT